MKLYRAAEMREADQAAAKAGVPGLLLMETAGRSVADSVLRNFPDCRRILVLCGKGNNGGDGFVAARHLHMMGRETTVLELAGAPPTGDAATTRTACLAHLAAGPLDRGSLELALESSDLVVDAMFGSGLTRALQGELADIVDSLNESGLPVLSIDVPSGVSSDRPLPPGPHVRATVTVQLAGAKLSSALQPARSAYGEQELVPIGIPFDILRRASRVRLLDAQPGAGIPERGPDPHKYTVGTVLVLAGSPRYLGAAELACRGAYRAGAGLVTLAAEARLAAGWPEVVFSALDWAEQPLTALAQIDGRRCQAVVAGPGLDERAVDHLPELLASRTVPWVLDAGALRPSPALRQAVRAHGRCVLTPHHGEAAKLLEGGDEVRADPLGAATRIASEWNAVCVLKGASTVVAGADGDSGILPESHPGMATGGTGDVLTGVLGAFLAAGGELTARVEAAVAVHGLAGRLAGQALGIGMIAGDVVDHLPRALRELSGEEP
ncbi:MAG: NAD(P)H-hydrate dehydratase [Trueperaceae bacterium]